MSTKQDKKSKHEKYQKQINKVCRVCRSCLVQSQTVGLSGSVFPTLLTPLQGISQLCSLLTGDPRDCAKPLSCASSQPRKEDNTRTVKLD